MRWGWLPPLALAALAGCGTTVDLDAVRDVTAPTLAPPPPTPGDSPHLAAIELRDTGRNEPSARSADASLLPAALDALTAERPAVAELIRLSIYEDTIHLTFIEPSDPSQATRAVYFATDSELRIHGSFFIDNDEDDRYPLAAVKRRVPTRLVRGIEERFTSIRVTSVDMRVSLSYGFELAWYLVLEDARGTLATVYADLDGAVIAVDER